MARYSLLPSSLWHRKTQNAEALYGIVCRWASNIVNELELRDEQVDATPSTKIYSVVTVTEIGRPAAGDIAYSASTGKFKGYVSSGATTEWQNLN